MGFKAFIPHVRTLHHLLTLIGLSACIPACIPMNTEYGSSSSATTTIDTAIATATSSSDGAQGQCATLDINHPDRRTCKSCYQTLLSQQCPSVTAASCPNSFATNPAACCSSSVASQFTTLVNQCILNSRIAGFTCATTCAAGLTLNARTCTCESTASTTTPVVGESGSAYINVGQTDYGPPVVSLAFDSNQSGVTMTEATSPGVLTQCGYPMSSSPAFWMSIRNRGNTIFQYNTYLAPILSTTVNGNGAALITGATPPQAGTGPLGANIFTKIGLQTAGVEEFSRLAGGDSYPRNVGGLGGTLGNTHLLSGRPEYTLPVTMTEDDLATPVPALVIPVSPNPGPEVYSPTIGATDEVGDAQGQGELASNATWASPGMGTVDRWGNIYFFDGKNVGAVDSSLRVICNDVRVDGTNRWCSGLTKGEIYPVLGVLNTYTGTAQARGNCDWHSVQTCFNQTGAAGTTARLSGNPGGLAIDRYGNIFFVDKGDTGFDPGVGVACAGTSGYCSTIASPGIGRVARIFDNVDNALTANSAVATLAAAVIHSPMSIDVETSGTSANILVGEATGNIRVYCGFASSQGPCATYPTARLSRPDMGNTPPQIKTVYSSTNPMVMANRVITLNHVGTILGFGMGQASDVKINYYGNVFYTERALHRISAICYDGTRGDLCAGKTGLVTLMGYGAPGSTSSRKRGNTNGGTSLTSATLLTYPTALAIRKPFADYSLVNEFTAPHSILPPGGVPTSASWDRIADHNLVFTEGFYITPANNLSGNKLGVMCGNNAKVAKGICDGLKANLYYQLSGKNGVSRYVAETPYEKLASASCGAYNTEPPSELFPFTPKPAASFAYNGITGVTYDGLGNLVVSSTSSLLARDDSVDTLACDDPLVVQYNRDNALYLLQLTKTGTTTAGIKFGFRDSNNLTSYYCMRVTAKSTCMRFDGNATCSCQPTQALDSNGFWLSSTANGTCP